jgi:hypothetical protein
MRVSTLLRTTVGGALVFGAALVGMVAFGCGCGGGGAAPAARATAPKPAPPSPEPVRAADREFQHSPGGAADVLALVAATSGARARLDAAGQAEADLVVALALARVIAEGYAELGAPRAPIHEVLAQVVLPRVFGERARDGELAPAFRDRLCQGPAQVVCAGVLPDYFSEVMAYAAVAKIAAESAALARACACRERHDERLAALVALAARAAADDAARRPILDLGHDGLARSAFAEPALGAAPDGVSLTLDDTTATIGDASAPTSKLRALEALLSAARAGKTIVVVDVVARAPAEPLARVATAATRAGFTTLVLEVRSAAPPHTRAHLRIGLEPVRAPVGARGVKVPNKATGQALVDLIDGLLGASAPPPPLVFVAR